ncbi:MAG: prepilin-type N-terminal cleavage/methylation domain-containing protein [Desulfosarcinaceae bacterium]|jgi:prepilin-type N-terminal cleavage/methylation domain-containing protein
MGNNKGFTLIEMVIVIAILAIVAGASVPHVYGWISNRRFASAVDELYVVFQKARIRAIRESQDVVLRFNAANDECEAFVDDGEGGGGAQNRVRDGSERRVDLVALPEGVQIDGVTFGGSWCGFDNRGITITPNNIDGELHLENTAGRHLGIGLNIAGNVRVIHSDDGGATWY